MTPQPPSVDLPQRDLHVVQLVAKFSQITAPQLRSILFTSNRSATPTDRTLKRLTDQKFLHRIERRMVGGARGGSGQYVYALGRRGFYLFKGGRYDPARNVNYHALTIVDSFVQLLELARAGKFAIVGYSTEPDCHAVVGGVQLKPDMHVEIARSATDRLKLWLEIDMGTEAQRQLKGKLEAYWRAYNDADVAVWPVFPRVVLVAIDEERARELAWLIEQGPKDAQTLFQVTTVAGLKTLLGG